ncbi:MAG: hypothetical protein LBK66_10255 [Spirochaetaceae bacterium]|jgi:hypothetical protein|nr:hypothetical protein [Spirochaetaceae bacterium]
MKVMHFGIIVFAVAVLFAGCATTRTAVPFSFVENEEESASIEIMGGNPGVWLVYFDKNELPQPAEETYWNPLSFPAGRPLEITVHAYYYQQSTTSTSAGVLGALISSVATSAIAASRNVDRDVLFTCPALEAGKAYKLVFRKGAGVSGENLLVLSNIETGKVVYEQGFENK